MNGSTELRLNQWHHIAFVRYGATEVTLYLDGQSEATYNIGTTAILLS